VTIAVLVFIPVSFILTRLDGMPRSLPGIVWFVLIAFMGGGRLLYRMLKEGRISNIMQQRINVLLVGASDEAAHFIRATLSDKESPYHVVGVLDDKASRVGREIHGIAILGQMNELARVVSELKTKGHPPSRLILAQSAGRMGHFEDFSATAEKLGLGLSRLPAMTDLRENLTRLQPIALEDLLGRPETLLNKDEIAALVTGKKVLVTGAGGTIGSELSRQIAALKPRQLLLLENGEFNLYTIEISLREAFPALDLVARIADVRDATRINSLFDTYTPNLIFHAAALKHVPIAELNERETILTNVLGTHNVADAAARVKADAFVLISTDKAVRPTNVMGATKRVAEHYCQALDHEQSVPTRFLTVRFGNVLGSTGSVVPRFQEQLAKGGPLTVTHPDITRYFMTVREAVELVLQASAHATKQGQTRGRIMVLDMGKPIKIADLARQIIRLAGLKPEVDIKITYTGLRVGEKLYEELFSDSERLEASGADGVLLAAAAPLPLSTLQPHLQKLITDARTPTADEETLRRDISAIVPDFEQK
jgi:O-antigen biosynthesis protein WbqV